MKLPQPQPLFDIINAAERESSPHNGTETSQAAADEITIAAARLRHLVFQAIANTRDRGATREEVEILTGLAGNTVRPRVDELRKMGLVIETTETRLTRAGRRAFVLRAV